MRLCPASVNASQNRLLALNYSHPGEDPFVARAHSDWGLAFQSQIQPLPEVNPEERYPCPSPSAVPSEASVHTATDLSQILTSELLTHAPAVTQNSAPIKPTTPPGQGALHAATASPIQCAKTLPAADKPLTAACKTRTAARETLAAAGHATALRVHAKTSTAAGRAIASQVHAETLTAGLSTAEPSTETRTADTLTAGHACAGSDTSTSSTVTRSTSCSPETSTPTPTSIPTQTQTPPLAAQSERCNLPTPPSAALSECCNLPTPTPAILSERCSLPSGAHSTGRALEAGALSHFESKCDSQATAPVREQLRVGYLSPDLYTHSVSYFAQAPLLHHDPNNVEVRMLVYSAFSLCLPPLIPTLCPTLRRPYSCTTTQIIWRCARPKYYPNNVEVLFHSAFSICLPPERPICLLS